MLTGNRTLIGDGPKVGERGGERKPNVEGGFCFEASMVEISFDFFLFLLDEPGSSTTGSGNSNGGAFPCKFVGFGLISGRGVAEILLAGKTSLPFISSVT